MDILSCPGALLTLNDLTMLLKTMTVSGCNKMDSERERHKKSLGEEFVGKILLDKFDVMLVKLSQKSLSYVNRITDFHSGFGEACRIWCFNILLVDHFIKNFQSLL